MKSRTVRDHHAQNTKSKLVIVPSEISIDRKSRKHTFPRLGMDLQASRRLTSRCPERTSTCLHSADVMAVSPHSTANLSKVAETTPVGKYTLVGIGRYRARVKPD